MSNLLKILIFGLISTYSHSKEFSCGMAVGYGPFQYLSNGVKSGVDTEVVEAFNSLGPNTITLIADKWDSLVSELYHIKGINCLVGTEMTPSRLNRFKFSIGIYSRFSTMVVTKDSLAKGFADLSGGRVCGDKDSALEYDINASKVPIRLVYMETKSKCIKALKSGDVDAAIMPRRVANFLSKEHDVEVREIPRISKSIDVGFAFKKNDPINLTSFNDQLKRLVKTEKFKSILKKYE